LCVVDNEMRSTWRRPWWWIMKLESMHEVVVHEVWNKEENKQSWIRFNHVWNQST